MVIDNPNALDTFFTYTVSADRTFRLWANRGMASEVYDDVTVYGTPSSNVPPIYGSSTGDESSIFNQEPYIVNVDYTGD